MGLLRNDGAHFINIEQDIKANPGQTAIYSKGNVVKIVDDKGDLKNLSIKELEVSSIKINGNQINISDIKIDPQENTKEVPFKDIKDTKNELEATKQELKETKLELEKLKETIKLLVSKEDFSLLAGSLRKQLEATSSDLNSKLDVKTLEVEKKLIESSSDVFVHRNLFDSKIDKLNKDFQNLLNLVMKKI